MAISPKLRERIVDKYRAEGQPGLDPHVVERIVDEVADALSAAPEGGSTTAPSPFDVSWMDSYVAHWALGQRMPPGQPRLEEASSLLREMMDARFDERVADIRRWLRESRTAPDGGPPEPGTPPAGPSRMEPPDGGPPEPGVPPTGPDAAYLGDNPWILYWFVSLKAPLLVDILDAHLTRRLREQGFDR